MNRLPFRGNATPITLMVTLLLSCITDDDDGQPTTVRIGAVVPMTGALGSGRWEQLLDLAEQDMNAAAVQADVDFRFEIAVVDSNTNAVVAKPRAQELVDHFGVKAIITTTSADHIAIHRTYYDDETTNDLHVPLIGAATASPLINLESASDPASRNDESWSYRVVMSSGEEAAALAERIVELGDRNGDDQLNIGIISDTSAGNVALAAAVADAIDRRWIGAQIEQRYVSDTVDPETYDWNATIDALVDDLDGAFGLQQGFPDVVIEIAFPQLAIAITRAYCSAQSDAPLFHLHGLRSLSTQALQDVAEVCGSSLDTMEGVAYSLSDNEIYGPAFQQAWATFTGRDLVMFDATVYDAAVIAMLAVASARQGVVHPDDITGAMVRDALPFVQTRQARLIEPDALATGLGVLIDGASINYDGISGPCNFDTNGNVRQRIERYELRNGTFVITERLDCVSDSSCPPEP